jgi:DNA methyltransferase 1-associated protein 1
MEFIFGRFNKQLEIPALSDAEYHNHLMVEGWTRAETDHLLDLCSRFDLRFPVIHDRWNRQVSYCQNIETLLRKLNSFCV